MSIRRETMVTPTRTDAPALRRMLAGTTALTTAAVCGWLLGADPAWALPTDGTVVEGQAEIIYGTDSVTIQQGSDRVVIEWQTFDVGSHESVTFIQPHELAAALNRVLSGDASQILGSLSANGQVFISNPAGVVFGPDANVDVASIVATSLDIMNDRFMAGGRLDFDIAGDPTAVIENRGTIEASGLAALVGPAARNSGAIVADVAILGGGQGFALDYYGDGLVNFAITDPTTQLPVDAEGNAVGALVENTGSILADGGQVILTADVAAGVIDTVINLDGVVQARTVGTREGQVVLLGGDEGTVQVAGTIDATGDDAHEVGGTVHVLGDTLELALGADIDVSGQAGGGTALVGGAERGGPLAAGGHIAYGDLAPAAGGTEITIDATAAFETESTVPTADIVYVDADAAIAADATDQGDGGTVVVWADEEAAFHGRITARGGAAGGDGGFAEVSSAGRVTVTGLFDLSAAAGHGGHVLIDPQNICLAAALATCATFDPAYSFVDVDTLIANLQNGTNQTVDTSLADDPGEDGDIVVLDAVAVDFAGGTGSEATFTLLADNDIIQNAAITGTNGSLSVVYQADGGITVNDVITVEQAGGVTLLAQGDIAVNASIQAGGDSVSETGGDVSLVAGWDGTTTDIDTILATVSTYGNNGGAIAIGDGSQTAGIAVGARFGASNFAGAAMTLQGSDAAVEGFAQAGFRDPGTADFDIDGTIIIALSDGAGIAGDLSATAGSQEASYVQVGHGGYDSDRNANEPDGDYAGDIAIELANNLTFAGSGGFHAYAQLGHGGSSVNGNHSGAITIGRATDLTFTGGGFRAYAQLGHGGVAAHGNHSGDIAITQARNITFAGGGLTGAYAQLGHGGSVGNQSRSGAITIAQANDLTIIGGAGASAYAQLGHGSARGGTSGTRQGDIDIRISGETSLVDGTGFNSRWLIGHATDTPGDISNADVRLVTGTLDFDAGASSTSFDISGPGGDDFAARMIANLEGGNVTLGAINGTAGVGGGMTVGSAFVYDSPNDLNLFSTTDIRFDASVQNGGTTASPGPTGAVNVVAGWDGTTTDIVTILATPSTYGIGSGIFIGDGTQTAGIAVGSRFGASNFAGAAMTLLGSDAAVEGFAQAGFRDPGTADFDIDGSITIALSDGAGNAGDLTATAGGQEASYVQVGHGGYDSDQNPDDSDGDYAGDIAIRLANDLTFEGGGVDAHAQLGHGGREADGDHTGGITITEAGNLTFNGGGSFAYAQLGHGGLAAGGNHDGAITIRQATDLTFEAGGAFAYAQLGHGGFDAFGTGATPGHSGDITIDQANNLTFEAGDAFAYAQLGHGGFAAGGNHDGAITITQANDLSFEAGSAFAYAQLGHGGHGAGGSHGGAITITQANDLTFEAGDAFAYAQLGHGGQGAGGDYDGAITITQANTLALIGGADGDAHAQLGHGDASGFASGTRQGDIDIRISGETSLVDGTGSNSPWLIGHATSTPGGISDADVTLITGTLDFDVGASSTSFDISGTGGDQFAERMIANLAGGSVTLGAINGTAGVDGGMTVGSAFVYESTSDLNLFSTTDIRFDASVQNGGTTASPGPTGAVNVVAGWDGATTDIATILATPSTYGIGSAISIGDGSQTTGIAVGSRFGANNFAGASMTLLGSDTTALGFAQAGFRDPGEPDFNIDGAITIALSDGTGTPGDLTAMAGTEGGSYVQVGHGGFDADTTINDSDGNYVGTITVQLANNVTFMGGAGLGAYAQLGNGGLLADGNHQGEITIAQAGNLTFTGGGEASYAQLGHGGLSVYGNHEGAIVIGQADNVTFQGGGVAGYAQLGHGGWATLGNLEGTIVIGQAGDMTFEGSDGDDAYAQLGHGGALSVGSISGDIIVTQAASLALTGRNRRGYAQVGHGGEDGSGSAAPDPAQGLTADIDLTLTGGVTLSAGDDRATAQIGHGGLEFFATGDGLDGSISVVAGGGISGTVSGEDSVAQIGHGGFSAGGSIGAADAMGDITVSGLFIELLASGSRSAAQIGHGGPLSLGDHTGAITVTATGTNAGEGFVRLSASGGVSPTFRATAQIGHGGFAAEGSYEGAIDVTALGGMELTGEDALLRYALIGHGDQPGDDDTGETVSGDVLVRVDGEATLTNAYIGHLIDADGAYESGDTFIGVAGVLTTDAASQLNSAPRNRDGELRIYLVSPDDDQVDAAALLNGVAHGAAAAPNNQGQFVFGTGPYAPGADVAGNFAYYTMPSAWNYLVDAGDAANIVSALNAGAVSLDTTLGLTRFGAVFDWDGSPSFIDVNAPIVYDSANALSFLATGDVTFNASVQNNGTGAVNTVAGWDGVTTDIATILANPATYGLNSSIVIGDGTQTEGIFVGSRFGASNFAGHSLTLRGSDVAQDGFAQAGFRDPGEPDFNIDGAITIALSDGTGTPGDLTAMAGTEEGSYVQVGHGGFDADTTINDSDGNYAGTITVQLANNVTFMGGAGLGAYAQLGHGGLLADGNHQGEITIAQAGNLTFTGSGEAGYAQLGHGGLFVNGNHEGAIVIGQAGDVTFQGGGNSGYAQLGHGGLGTVGGLKGTIVIGQAGDMTFEGSNGEAYAQLGHGGALSLGSISGDIIVTQAASLALTGRGGRGYAQVGHGGEDREGSAAPDPAQSLTADIDLTLTGGVTLSADDDRATAQIGHGGREFFSTGDGLDGSISVVAGGGISGTASGEDSVAQIGHGGFSAGGSIGAVDAIGDITVSGLFTELLASGSRSAAQIGHGGPLSRGGVHTGAITVIATGTNAGEGFVRLLASGLPGSAIGSAAQIGHGGFVATGGALGDITVTANGPDDAIFAVDLSSKGDGNFAQIGHGGVIYNSNAAQQGRALGGAIAINATAGSLNAAAGGVSSAVQVGHGGSRAVFASASGDITLDVFGGVSLTGGDGDLAYAQLGHGGISVSGDLSGTITISRADDLTFTGGAGEDAYAQLGHGGADSDGNHSGDIIVAEASRLMLLARRAGAYAQVGHGGEGGTGSAAPNAALGLTADIDLTLTGGVNLSARELGTTAQIGHGGRNFAAIGDGLDGSITVVAGEGVSTVAGGEDSVAQIGHGGFGASGSTGAVTVSGLEIALLATGAGSTAQFGHGGPLSNGDHSGDITVTATGTSDEDGFVRLSASGGLSASSIGATAQIGHGGFGAIGGALGDITVTANGLDNAIFAVDLSAPGNRNFAQIGHGGVGYNNNAAQQPGALGGAIAINATAGSLNAAAGGFSTAVQVGHGGAFAVFASASGDINLDVFGGVSFTGGDGNLAYAQLGHGGPGSVSAGAITGEINILQANGLTFQSGSGSGSYTQLGHGGGGARFASASGDINFNVFGDVSFTGGDGSLAYTQLGHGGPNSASTGATTGEINILGANDLTFQSGSGSRSYTQLGHGGGGARADSFGGAINVAVTGAVTFAGGGASAFSQLGHGGADSFAQHGITGAIDIEAASLALTGRGNGAYAQVGHGGEGGTGSAAPDAALGLTADIDITLTGGVTLSAGELDSTAQIGHGGRGFTAIGDGLDGAITVVAGGGVSSTAGGRESVAQIGHGGFDASGSTGAVAVSGLFIELLATGAGSTAQVGHGGPLSDGGHSGDITVTATGTSVGEGFVRLSASGAPSANLGVTAQIGHGGYAANGSALGDITVTANGPDDAVFAVDLSSLGDANFARIGHGGELYNLFAPQQAGALGGAIAINATAGSLNAAAGGFSTAVQVGHGGVFPIFASASGDINLDLFGGVSFTGDGDFAYAQLGHGGPFAVSLGAVTGAINILRATDLTFQSGSGAAAYTQLGHGGYVARADSFGGAISVAVTGTVTFTGGEDEDAFSRLGHGGAFSFARNGITGAIDIEAGNDLRFAAGIGSNAFAHLGHGGGNVRSDVDADISVAADAISFSGGLGGGNAFAQLGHGGNEADGDFSGTIDVTATSLTFVAGSANDTYAQLGHGGDGAGGDHGGAITVGATGGVTFTAGSGDDAYAQLGHGGVEADGSFSGAIDLTVLGDLTLTGQNPVNQYALIGHGDEPNDGDGGDTVDGNVLVRIGGGATLTNAFIGHLIDADGEYESGDTFVGVNGVLTTDAASRFTSAPQANGGELRIYLTAIANDGVDPNALLNGMPHGAAQGPNNQGVFGFGLGPYVPGTAVGGGPTVDGNFAYYVLATPLFAAAVDPTDVPTGFPTDVETLLDRIRGAQSQVDRPGGAAFFTNELAEPFQTSVFTDGFAIGGLQPAAGGGTNGPINLADLEPAAGPGSEQAQAEDTCVETYFGDFWNIEPACQ